MTLFLATVLALAALLILRSPQGAAGRFRRATSGVAAGSADKPRARAFRWARPGTGKTAVSGPAVPMTLVVQQLAALLKGGRTPARLWD